MAKQDNTGAGAPDQPQYPMIEPGDPETTYIRTEVVLAFVQEFVQARALSIEHYGDNPPDESICMD